jgi:hypothetical protein
MPAVKVQDGAYTDPRLTACARALRMSRPALLVAVMQLWSRVQAQGHTRLRVELVAGAMGKRPPAVSAAFGLYELAVADGDVLDLDPLGDLFGDVPFAVSDPSENDSSREREREKKRRQRERRRGNQDLSPGTDGGQTGDNDGDGRGHVPGTTPSPFPPPTTPPNTPSPKIPPPRAHLRDPGQADAGSGLGQYTQLYEKHRAVVAAVAPAGAVKLLGAVNVLHSIRECLNHPAIREQGQAEIERALELLGVQAKAKANAGETDPWWLLENAWSPGVLEKALKCRDEETARQRAVRSSRGGPGRQVPLPTSQPPASHEEFIREADRLEREREARNGSKAR